jgi:hypothetical protein
MSSIFLLVCQADQMKKGILFKQVFLPVECVWYCEDTLDKSPEVINRLLHYEVLRKKITVGMII